MITAYHNKGNKFILLLFFGLVSAVLSEDTLFSKVEMLDPRLEIKIINSINAPTFIAAESWSPFYTVGLQVSFPAGIIPMRLHFSGEIGNIHSTFDNNLKVESALLRLLISYTLHQINRGFYLRFNAGLMDMMIHHNDEGILSGLSNGAIFMNVENEFGATFGIEPGVKVGSKFVLSLPICYDIVFSSPTVYQSINFTFAIGILFE